MPSAEADSPLPVCDLAGFGETRNGRRDAKGGDRPHRYASKGLSLDYVDEIANAQLNAAGPGELPGLEAFLAEDRTPLSGLERDGCFLPAAAAFYGTSGRDGFHCFTSVLDFPVILSQHRKRASADG